MATAGEDLLLSFGTPPHHHTYGEHLLLSFDTPPPAPQKCGHVKHQCPIDEVSLSVAAAKPCSLSLTRRHPAKPESGRGLADRKPLRSHPFCITPRAVQQPIRLLGLYQSGKLISSGPP